MEYVYTRYNNISGSSDKFNEYIYYRYSEDGFKYLSRDEMNLGFILRERLLIYHNGFIRWVYCPVNSISPPESVVSKDEVEKLMIAVELTK